MAMPIGTIDSQGRKYFRCPDCGDSKKRPYIAHCFADRFGNTYCYRCQTSRQLSVDAMIKMLLEDNYEPDETIWTPKTNVIVNNSGRKTLLTKYNDPEDMSADAFAMRDSYGDLIGWHTRFANKVMHNEGQRGINWPGADDGIRLTSSRTKPLTIVEGPYDVLRPDAVAAYGAITYSTMKHLKYQHVNLWPDPDMLDNKYKRAAFVKMMQLINDNLCFVHGLYVSNDDPDKATKTKYVSLADAINHVKKEACYA